MKEGKVELARKGILEVQGRINRAREAAETIRGAIAHQEKLIQETEAAIPTVHGLAQKREDLLADIAMGADRGKELVELDQEIDAASSTATAAKEKAKAAAGPAKQAISGLARKLAEVEADIQYALSKDLPAAVEKFLLEKATAASEEYMELAKALIGKHLQICGLGSLIERRGGSPKKILTSGWDDFKIPSFNLPACEKMQSRMAYGAVFKFSDFHNVVAVAAKAELEEVQRLGVEI